MLIAHDWDLRSPAQPILWSHDLISLKLAGGCIRTRFLLRAYLNLGWYRWNEQVSLLLLNSNRVTGHCLDWSHWGRRQRGHHVQRHGWPGDLLPQKHRALDKERRHGGLRVLAVFHDTRRASDLGCRRCILLYPRGYSSKSIKGMLG